ncbi:MAG: hypothetical protein H7Y11_07900 [Armatimonadetes bacterium]|nr:hypothetical protein [Anaerolineae bacterium]
MMLSEILKVELQKLNRVEKLRVMHMLVEQLAQEEALLTGQEYEIWSPYDAPGAAAILTEMLAEAQQQHG